MALIKLKFVVTSFIILNSYNTARANVSDIKLQIDVGRQKELALQTDSQISISRKNVIDIKKLGKDRYRITALKKGFTILDPTPLTQIQPRILITVDKRKSNNRNSSLKILGRIGEENYTLNKNKLKINCLHPLYEKLYHHLEKMPQITTTCRDSKYAISFTLEEISLNSSESLEIEKKYTKKVSPNYSKMSGTRNIKFTTSFLITNFSNTEKHKKIVSFSNIYIKIKSIFIHRTNKKKSIRMQLNISSKKMKKDISIYEKFEKNLEKTLLVSEYGIIEKSSGRTSNLSSIPIIGIIFKNFRNQDKRTKILLTFAISEI